MITWSPLAIEDLTAIRTYIGKDNVSTAKAVIATIFAITEQQLVQFPKSGREGRVSDTRELVIPKLPYLVIYRECNGTIEILRIFHTAQALPGTL